MMSGGLSFSQAESSEGSLVRGGDCISGAGLGDSMECACWVLVLIQVEEDSQLEDLTAGEVLEIAEESAGE